MFTGDDPVLIIIADQSQSDVALYNSGDPSQVLRYSNPANAFLMVALDNANVVARLIEPLALKHRRYLLKGEAATNLADLRSGPSILVGGFDNAWTLRMTNSLRFRFANTPGPWPSILDTASPSKVWKLVNDRSVGTYIDYAIVARFTADNTQRPTVVIAGLGRCASLAAGQFVTDSGSLAKLQHEAQSNGNKKNIEVVISTQVVDGQPGSPKIEAAYFW